MNTEYKKRVMDNLDHISKELNKYSDENSDHYWSKKGDIVIDYLEKIVDVYINEDKYDPKVVTHLRTSIDKAIMDNHIKKLLFEVQSEPFLPEEVINKINFYLKEKVHEMDRILYEEIIKFKKQLRKGQYDHCLSDAPYIVSNIINDKMYENACGVSQIEEDIQNIRLYIRKYLKSFDPFN